MQGISSPSRLLLYPHSMHASIFCIFILGERAEPPWPRCCRNHGGGRLCKSLGCHINEAVSSIGAATARRRDEVAAEKEERVLISEARRSRSYFVPEDDNDHALR